MSIFLFKTSNPSRKLHIEAENREAADVKFAQMREASGLTADSKIESVIEVPAMENIVEHAPTEAEKPASETDAE